MKHVLMFAADDGGSGGSGGGSGGNDDDFENAAELRDKAARLGRILTWHAENSPLSTWAAAIYSDLPWPGNLLHALHEHRPKRPATAAETAELARLYKIRTRNVAPPDLFRMLASDPDWHMFELRLDDPPMPEGEI